jgi:hypothetical protein
MVADVNSPPPRADLTHVGRWWGLVLAFTVGLSAVGGYVGYRLVTAAQQNQACAHRAQSSSWRGIQISGLPSMLQSSFGYGRGTQVIESTLNAAAPAGVTLPASIAVFAEPLTTSDGTQTIPSASLSGSGKQLGPPGGKRNSDPYSIFLYIPACGLHRSRQGTCRFVQQSAAISRSETCHQHQSTCDGHTSIRSCAVRPNRSRSANRPSRHTLLSPHPDPAEISCYQASRHAQRA